MLVLTGESHTGHEHRNLHLANELVARGYHVVNTGPSQKIFEKGHNKPWFDDSFSKREDARSCNTRLFSSGEELRDLILWSDIVLLSTSRGYGEYVKFAHEIGKVLIQHRDIGGIEWVFYEAHLVAVRSAYEMHWFQSMIDHGRRPEDFERGYFNFSKLLPSGMVATGSTQFDDMPDFPNISRTDFFRKYGLSPDKKMAVYFPHSPAFMTGLSNEKYVAILEVLKNDPTHEVLIKPHPQDYARFRQTKTFDDATMPTWEKLGLDVPICGPEDKYNALALADVVLSRQSTMSIEGALFGTPMLFVDFLESKFECNGVDGRWIKEQSGVKRFTGSGRKTRNDFIESIPGVGLSAVPAHAKELMAYFQRLTTQFFPNGVAGLPDYIGSECTIEELPEILASQAYKFDQKEVYDSYIADECYANDGLAYKRVADVVDSVWERPQLVDLIRNGRRRRWRERLKEMFRRLKARLPSFR